MKNLILCDSGLGGLDIAASFFKQNKQPPEWNLIYINAFPDPKFGYNDLAENSMQEAVFQTVLEGMERFCPALCLIACNTLSIVWQRLSVRYRPSFPVMGIIEEAVKGMTAAARNEPDAHLLILGSSTTISSNVYPEALQTGGIAAERIHSLACPGLARLLEKDPAAPEVRQRIADYACETAAMLSPCRPAKLILCFCCTHYGYAEFFWQQEFSRYFPVTAILNPNRMLQWSGSAADFAYYSRLPLEDHQRTAMSEWFSNSAPPIAKALKQARPDRNLFRIPEGIQRKNSDSFLS